MSYIVYTTEFQFSQGSSRGMPPYFETLIDLQNLGPESLSSEFWNPLFGLHSLAPCFAIQ